MTWTTKSAIFAILISNLLNSCGKPVESSLATIAPDPFLTVADLSKGSKIKELTKENVEKLLKENDDLYDAPAETRLSPKAENCIANVFNQLPLTAYDSYVGVGAEVDISDCTRQELGNPNGVNIDSSTIRIAVQLGCDNQDFSALNGKKLADLSQSGGTLCQAATKNTQLYHLKFKFSGSTISEGNQLNFEYMTLRGESLMDGQPCAHTVDGELLRKQDGCSIIDKSMYTIYRINGNPQAREGLEDYSSLESSNLISKKESSTSYNSGKMKVTINNWAGDVNYSESNSSPTYSVTNGGDNASGSLRSTRRSVNRNIVSEASKIISKSILKSQIDMANPTRARQSP
jgi:hypothetical protein